MNRREPFIPPDVERYFGPDGLLNGALQGFRVRSEQRQLASAIWQAINARQTLVAEAGTGVGKTFAYLVPALVSGRKAIVSTASKTLQDQLFGRDIPKLLEILGLQRRVVRLKGRSNYLCLYRMEIGEQDARFSRAQDWQVLRAVRRFSAQTVEGDLSDCVELPEESAVTPWVTSTADNCLGNSCPRIADCFVAKARAAAWAADLVVVNHHLFCADLALRREADQSLLPELDLVVLDEAHAFIPTASQAFSESVSTHQYVGLARDMLPAGLRLAKDGAPWADLAARLEQSSLVVRQDFASLPLGKWDWSRLETDRGEAVRRAVAQWAAALHPIQHALRVNRERHPELERLADRADTLVSRLTRFQAGTEQHLGQAFVDSRDRCQENTDGHDNAGERVFWLEKTKSGLSLHDAPLDLSGPLRSVLHESNRSWIFLSATLSAGPSASDDPEQAFSYFTRRLGLQPDQTLLVGSPFDFQRQALFLLPKTLPDPKSTDLIAQLLSLPGMDILLHRIPGGVLILCTSLRSVALAAETLRRRPSQFLSDRRLLVQGEAPRSILLAEFRAHGRGLLIGSTSFWEGVDVPGLALAMVLIDKLPFASPDDPVMQARLNQSRRRGEDPFRSIQVPEALLALKQGIGRLIRSESDRGVLMIGDRRLYETGFGRSMRAALPRCQEAGSLDDAIGIVDALFELH
ncbi:MAG: hypothetical protein RLZZ344_1520 [Pseudomonadota bacterium]|jgi:ATP-dependent DNA helicase DinG